MLVTPSLKLIQLLERLTRDWSDWKTYHDYYINELLPSLKNNLGDCGSGDERQIISQIKIVASKEEWDHLGEIVVGLDKFRNNYSNVTKVINNLLEDGKYEEAEKKYRDSENIIYTQLRQEHLVRVTARISVYLRNNNAALAERELEAHSGLLAENERISFKNMIQGVKVTEEILKHNQLVEKIQHKIEYLLQSNYLERAKNELELHSDQLTLEERTGIEFIIYKGENDVVERVVNNIKDQLAKFNYTNAEYAYNEISSKLPRVDFENMLQQARAKEVAMKHVMFMENQIEKISALLNEYKFDEAASVHQSIVDYYPIEMYQNLEARFKVRLEKDKFLKDLDIFLSNGDFCSADRAYSQSNLLSEVEYVKEKAKYVDRLLMQYGEDASVNEEQAFALAHIGKQILVTARAGSGKTRLLSAKALLLIDYENIHPDHILIMTFNRDAVSTVKARTKSLAKSNLSKAFENARTFHGLAYQIVQPPTDKLLFDNKGEFARKEFSEFVQSIFRELATPEYSIRLYQFFRREMASAQRAGALKDDKDYYVFMRNQQYTTLMGQKVKSIGEKFIADFLFEHNINYKYEKDYLWNSGVYRPDFSVFINNTQYIIEHWGIDENDHSKSVPVDWKCSWDDYHDEMQKKREYWVERAKSNGEKKKFVLIEVSVTDLKNGRAAFERILKAKLERFGVVCRKLSEQELAQNTYRLQVDRMTNLLVQFILKAKKKRWNANETAEKVASFSNTDAKTNFFLELGCKVYKAYEEKIMGKIDFDELVSQAIQRIYSSNGNLDISVDSSHSRYFKLSELEWLFIDEYQDFSLLFYDLVRAILRCNPKLRIMCVGDDWQAINSYAGSDLFYFREFITCFPDAKITALSTNYRSKSVIVESGNKIMQGLGAPAKPAPSHQGGCVFIDDMEAVKLTYKVGDTLENNPDMRFLLFEKTQNAPDKLRSNSYMVGKYLKACHNILTNEKNRNKSFVILSRNNQIYGIDLKDFLAKLISSISLRVRENSGILESGIRVSTTHSYKGLESDCVIMLQACQGYFPSLHPDNRLFEIFGQTDKSVLDEERRLFYVAVTRARENLFILTEKSRPSDFLDNLPEIPFLR